MRAGMSAVICDWTQQHLEEATVISKRRKVPSTPSMLMLRTASVSERAAEQAIKMFGKIHVFVNNAGVVHPARRRAIGTG